MQIKKIAAATAIILALSTTTALARQGDFQPTVRDKEIQHDERYHPRERERERDPVKILEAKKQKIKKLLKEGKIPKEKADEIINKIDKKIKEVKEFQKLPLELKRQKIINDFKIELDGLVKDGRMKQQEADQLLKDVTEKMKHWDGSGYPRIRLKEKKESDRKQ